MRHLSRAVFLLALVLVPSSPARAAEEVVVYSSVLPAW